MIGTVQSIRDCGSVIQVFVRSDTGKVFPLCADGNLMRIAIEDSGLAPGDQIEYASDGWGDLQSFAIL